MAIIRPPSPSVVTVSGLTVKNVQHSPINLVDTNGAVIQDLPAYDSGTPVQFAGGSSHCSADGLHIYNIDIPGEAGFAFYGGPHVCALRNSVIRNSSYGVVVLNDSAQAGVTHDIVVENVEVYNNASHGFLVTTHGGLPVNHDVVFQHARVHNNGSPVPYVAESGDNITFTDIDLSGTSNTSRSQIVGYVDVFIPTGGGTYDLHGWSCTSFNPDPVYVAVFAGSTVVAWVRADRVSEPAVAAACQSGGARIGMCCISPPRRSSNGRDRSCRPTASLPGRLPTTRSTAPGR